MRGNIVEVSYFPNIYYFDLFWRQGTYYTFFTLNRSVKKYQYESLITGEIQEERPKDGEDQRTEISQLLKLQESGDDERTSSTCTENGTSGTPSTGDKTVDKCRLKQPGPPQFESSQDITFPPLPPLPPEDILGSPTPAVPPLPIDDCSTNAILPCPPPPPDPLPHEKHIDQLNTSTDQVCMSSPIL